MKVTIQFRGPITRQINGGIIEVEIKEDLTIDNLLALLINQETSVKSVWNSPTDIDRDTMILCNNVDIGVAGGLGTMVRDGDVFTILPLVHGG